ILLNQEVIAIDQDTLGQPALIVHDEGGPQVWVRPLADPNARAVAVFNPTDAPATLTIHWSEVGLAPGVALVRDLWAHADRGAAVDSFTATVEPHGTAMLKITTQAVAAGPTATPTGQFAPPADLPAPADSTTYPYLSDLPATFAGSAF